MEDRQGAEGKELRRDGEAEAPGKVFPTSQRERSVALILAPSTVRPLRLQGTGGEDV